MAVETLVGKVPEKWEYTTLGEACARGGGDIQTGPFGSQLHAADYVPSGIPSIMPQNIGDNRVVPEGIARITKQDAERLSRYRVRPWDIVYSRRGDVERRALIRPSQDGWLCGTGCLRVRFGGGQISPVFASYYLGDSRVREWIVRHAHGATMPNLNTSILSALPFVVPPPEEQQFIARILGVLDDKIDLNRRMNETLEGIAQALFKSWFVDFDPVRAKAQGHDPGLPRPIAELFPSFFEGTELGDAPKGWETRSLGDICLRVSMGPFGSDIKTDNFVPVGVPVVRGGNLKDGFVDDRFVYLSEEKATELKNANAFPGDLVITHRGTLGQVGIIPRKCRFPRYVVSQSQMVLSVDPSQASPEFVFSFLCSKNGQYQLLANTSQTGVPAIARPTTSVKAIRIVLPPTSILRLFDTVVGRFSERRNACRVESRTLIALRDALLSKLISGELRIPDAERIVGAQA